jgi:hypothetical protein
VQQRCHLPEMDISFAVRALQPGKKTPEAAVGNEIFGQWTGKSLYAVVLKESSVVIRRIGIIFFFI